MAHIPKQTATKFELGIDRAISFINPDLAAKRLASRERYFQFSYEAANPGISRVRAGSQAKNSSSENPKSRRDRIRLIWEARQASNDLCLFRGLMWSIPKYVCGRLSYKADTGDIEQDKLYNNFLEAEFKKVDVTGRHDLLTLTQVALRSMLIDGDHGALLLQRPEGIRLQMIEADRIGSPIDASISETLVSGVEIDECGAPQAYHIYNRNRVTSQYLLEGVYPASQFLHIFDPFRIDQYRGVSHLATAIPHLRDLYELFGFEKVGAKFASMWAAFVTKKDAYSASGNGAPIAGWDSEMTDKDGKKKGFWEAQPGRIQVLDPDTEIKIATGTNRPSGEFMALAMALIRESAISLDLPYGFVYDMSVLGGATSRIEIEKAQRTFEHWQNVLVRRFLDHTKDAIIDFGISTGQLTATEFAHNGKWTFGAQITADVSYQAQTDIANIMNGLDTATNVLEKRGGNYGEVMKTLSSEITIAQENAAQNGTPMEIMAPQRFQGATQALAAMASPPTPPPTPGSLALVGDKGAKQIVELLVNVSTGMLDRASAINTLVTVYGLDPEQAEEITPPQGKRIKPKAGSNGDKKEKNLSSSSRIMNLSARLDANMSHLFGKPGVRAIFEKEQK